MTHTDYQADLDPQTPGVQEHGHFHRIIRWECEDEAGHGVSMVGAECQIKLRKIDEPNYEIIHTAVYPESDVQIIVSKDGNYELQQRQRTNGGRWADWTRTEKIEINLKPSQRPLPPGYEIGESDGVTTEVTSWGVYPDRDIEGNIIEPAQMLFQVLAPCGDPEKDWITKGVLNYPHEKVKFHLPVREGVSTYQLRIRVSNICEILSEPSPVVVLDINDTRLKSSGGGSIMKGCL